MGEELRNIDLTPAQLKIISGFLKRYIPETEVWAYGSRVKWTSKPQSDLDMVAFAAPEQKRSIYDLKEAFEESSLPFRVDLFIWNEIPEQFHKNIEAERVVLQGGEEERGMVSEWERMPLGNVAKLVGGFAFKSQDFIREGVPVIKIKNVRHRDIDLTDVDYVSKETTEKCSRFLIKNGDVLISMTGSGIQAPASIVGRVARHSGVDDSFLINQRVGRFEILKPDCLDIRFLYYFFSQRETQLELVSIATGSANQVNLSAFQIESIDIPFPPLAEQKAIAHILGSLDDKIELNRRMNATLEGMAQALFKSWFVDFDPVIDNALAAGNPIPEELAKRVDVRRQALADGAANREAAKQFPAAFQLTEEMGWIPEGWETGKINNLAELNSESWSNRSHPEHIKYVDLANTKNGRINEVFPYDYSDAPSRARRVLREDDTIIGTVRPGNRSFAYIHEGGLTGSTGFAVLRPKRTNSRIFIYLCLTQDKVIENFAHLADGGAYPAIRPEVVGNREIVIFDSDLMSFFDQQCYPLIAKIGRHQQETESLAKLRDTLLPKLISGEIRIPEVEKLTKEAQV